MALNPPITDWREQRVWLVGASSGIGAALAEALLERGARVALSARRESALVSLRERYGAERVLVLPFDVTEPGAAAAACEQLCARWQGCDFALYAAGHYRAMRGTEIDLDEALKLQEVNLTGAWRWLDVVVPLLRAQRHGHVSLIASVAGYGGLPQALAYSPTKAALIRLAETLYMDLQDDHVGVSIVNPGFVQTPLTEQNTFRMPALQTPEQAVHAMLTGWRKGRFEIAFPRRLVWPLGWLQCLPYGVYFRLVRRATGL